MADEIPVRVTNGFGAKSQAPFVLLVLGDHMTQMSPAKARELAGFLVECAEAADQDAFLVRFLRDTVGIEEEIVWGVMHSSREARAAARTEGDG
jgi:hypothetical protein